MLVNNEVAIMSRFKNYFANPVVYVVLTAYILFMFLTYVCYQIINNNNCSVLYNISIKFFADVM